MKKTVEEYAKLGAKHEVMDALRLLTLAYISQCGISRTDRTVAYVAGEAWYKRLLCMNQPLSKRAMEKPLVSMMPYFADEYQPEIYDKYDIIGLSEEDLQKYCQMALDEGQYDEATNEVLCWGIHHSKTIVYLHGFGSSGLSSTVEYLRKQLPTCNVLAPDIPVNPAEALPFLQKLCLNCCPDLIIGTSMGAMYAMQIYNYKRICVNPALWMSELTDILKPGTFEYFQPAQNGETHFTITEETIKQFRDMEAHMYDDLYENSRQNCWGFFGDKDTTVNCKDEFRSHFAPNIQIFHGGHRMTNAVLRDSIIPFAKKILQQRRTK